MNLNRALAALCAAAFLTALDASAEPQPPATINLGETLQELPADPFDPSATAMSANDNFASAITVATFPFSATGSNSLDTTQSGEPSACPMGHTVWYKVVPAVTGLLYADTRGSSFDTVLAGYQGTTLASLSLQACNDDTADLGLQSRIQFPVFAGTTYYVQLGGFDTNSGTFILFIDNFATCSSNDNQAGACTVSALPYSDAQSTAGATTEIAEPPAVACPVVTISHTVWYRYTVPTGVLTQGLTASSAGSSYDTVVDVFAAGAGQSLVPVACNDDFGGGVQSQVSWTGTGGTTYLIRVSGFGAAFGNMAFSLS